MPTSSRRSDAFLEQVSLVADADSIPDAERRRRHADDAAHRQGPGVPGRVPHRHGGRRLPAHARARRPGRAGRGAPAGLRRHHPGPRAAVPVAGAVALGVGRAVLEPAVAVPRRDPGELVEWTGAVGRAPFVDRYGDDAPARRATATTATGSGGRARSAAERPGAARVLPARVGADCAAASATGRSRRSRSATGSPTTRGAWARSSPPAARARGRRRRSTSAATRRQVVDAALRARPEALTVTLPVESVRPAAGPGADPGWTRSVPCVSQLLDRRSRPGPADRPGRRERLGQVHPRRGDRDAVRALAGGRFDRCTAHDP